MFNRANRIYNRQEIMGWQAELNRIPNNIQARRLEIQNHNQSVAGWQGQITHLDQRLRNINNDIALYERAPHNLPFNGPMGLRAGWNGFPNRQPLIVGSPVIGGNLYPDINMGFPARSFGAYPLRLRELYNQRDNLFAERARYEALMRARRNEIANIYRAIDEYNLRNTFLAEQIRLGNQYFAFQALPQPLPFIAPPMPIVARPIPVMIPDAPQNNDYHVIPAHDENDYQTALRNLRDTLGLYPQNDQPSRRLVAKALFLISFIEREKNDPTQLSPLGLRINNYTRALNLTNELAQRPTDAHLRNRYRTMMNEIKGAPTHSSKLGTILAGVLSAVIVIASICALALSPYFPVCGVLGAIGLVAGVAGIAGSIAYYQSGMYRGLAKQAKGFYETANRVQENPNLNPPVNNRVQENNPRENSQRANNPGANNQAFFAAPAANQASAAPPAYAALYPQVRPDNPPPEVNPAFRC